VYRAMRGKSGLRMNDGNGRAVARLKSEYCGPASKHVELTTPFSDVSADGIYGVVTFEKPTALALRELINAIEQCGLKPEFDPAELERALQQGG
jgi:hypothetical protein